MDMNNSIFVQRFPMMQRYQSLNIVPAAIPIRRPVPQIPSQGIIYKPIASFVPHQEARVQLQQT